MDSVSVEQMHFIKGNCYIELTVFFHDWNRWNDRFSCCGSLFGTNPAQAGEKAEGADLERVSIKSNRGV